MSKRCQKCNCIKENSKNDLCDVCIFLDKHLICKYGDGYIDEHKEPLHINYTSDKQVNEFVQLCKDNNIRQFDDFIYLDLCKDTIEACDVYRYMIRNNIKNPVVDKWVTGKIGKDKMKEIINEM